MRIHKKRCAIQMTHIFFGNFGKIEITKNMDCDLNFYKADAYVVGTTFALRQERYHFNEF